MAPVLLVRQHGITSGIYGHASCCNEWLFMVIDISESQNASEDTHLIGNIVFKMLGVGFVPQVRLVWRHLKV